MNRNALTELAIKKFKCPADLSHLEVFDTDVIGLYIDVFPSGKNREVCLTAIQHALDSAIARENEVA